MGKGDIKTKRGKIASGTFGVSRPHKRSKSNQEVVVKEAEQKKESKPAVKKATAKKSTTKKTTKKAEV